MNPGQLNSKITLKHLVRTEDESGGYAEGYEEYTKVWAKLVPQRQGKHIEGEELITDSVYEITIRYCVETKFTDRLYLGSRIFKQITPPINIMEKKQYLKLVAEEVTEVE